MHEIALHINHNVDDFRAPFTEESIKAASGQSNVLSAAHSSALLECLTAVHGIFDSFFRFELTVIRALPIFYFVRVAYAVVVLMKFHFAVSAPGSDVGKIIDKDALQVEQYLNRLLEVFHAVDAEDSFRPNNRFLTILGKLMKWFQANKDNKSLPRDASRFNQWASAGAADDALKRDRMPARQRVSPNEEHGTPVAAKIRQDTQQRTKFDDSTPLHFLSDVATTNSNTERHYGREGSNNNSKPNYSQMSTHQQQNGSMVTLGQQQAPSGWYRGMQAGNEASVGPGYAEMMGSDGTTLGSTDMGMGAGFEEAIDMTLGTAEPDLSTLFMGDPMFNFGAGFGAGSGEGMYFQSWQ